MNLFDIYFAVMGGAPPQRPVYTPPPAPAPVSPQVAAPTTKKAPAPASSPSPVDNAVAAREKNGIQQEARQNFLDYECGGCAWIR